MTRHATAGAMGVSLAHQISQPLSNVAMYLHVGQQMLAAKPAELVRVARPGSVLLMSTPLHPSRWTDFDDFVGHKRRYQPRYLLELLAQNGLAVERSAVFGMKPRSSRLVDIGMWWLTHHRELAMNTYNRAMMPLGLRLQKPLQLEQGLIDMDGVDEILLACRKGAAH